MKLRVISSGSSGNCYVVEADNGKRILLDVGIAYANILPELGYDLMSVEGIFVTHRHKDHSKALDKFIHYGVPCFGNDDLASRYVGCIAMPKVIRTDNFKVQSFAVEHDVPNNAFIVDLEARHRLLYITDSSYITQRVKSVKTALIECNYDNEYLMKREMQNIVSRSHPENHLELYDCAEYINEINDGSLERVILCHLSSENIVEQHAVDIIREQTGIAEVYVAKAGFVIDF